jgi:hypothetical protein
MKRVIGGMRGLTMLFLSVVLAGCAAKPPPPPPPVQHTTPTLPPDEFEMTVKDKEQPGRANTQPPAQEMHTPKSASGKPIR